MQASDYIAAFLAKNCVTTVYELTGGMITFLLDSIGRRGDIHIVSMHHEQAAAFAAEGHARVTGVPGVALATSGPGATNLLTGIGSCFFDSVPAVIITGQVNTNEQRGNSGVRQAGFQETDIVEIAKPITKATWRITSADQLPDALAEAFRVALGDRPGPVLLDIPMNVQRQEIDEPIGLVIPTPHPSPSGVAEALEILSHAERPLIVAGGGVRASASAEALREFAEASGIPVVNTLMGVDVLPYEHPLRVGLIGTYGNRWANLAMRDSDCLLVLGARLDVRQTGADVDDFRAGKTLIQVDTDEHQLAWRVPVDVPVHGDLAAFLHGTGDLISGLAGRDYSSWVARIVKYRRQWPEQSELPDAKGINPVDVMRRVSSVASMASAFVLDVGQNQMWAAQSLRLVSGQRFLTSGGMGAMGFALPAGIGAAIATPDRPVVVIAGDGGFQVNLQELETVARLRLPLKIIVLNNGCLGMVRQLQDELFASRYHSTVWGYGAPDFVAVAEAYAVPARRAVGPFDLDDALAWLMEDPSSPAVLEIGLDSHTCVRPKVTFGNAVYVMDKPVAVEEHDG